jgi:hypothetical protein
VGLRDALFGRSKVKGFATQDRLFAITTAAIELEAAHGVRPDGAAAIVFQRLETGDFAQIVAEMEEVVRSTGEETGTTTETTDDSYGYRWMILRDPDVDDLTVGVNAVSEALELGGYGERVLCAVFAFRDSGGGKVYFIYNYKRGHWYPFVPGDGAQQRRNERELQLKAQIGNELPIEPELERWFPLWGIPI